MRKSALKGRSAISLRDLIVEAASEILVQEGYENLSMRRVAQVVGCSQMAMYRHFANKEALTQHICGVLYTNFVTQTNRQIQAVSNPWERLRSFISAVIQFAVTYPDHYSLIFLTRHSNPIVIAEREKLGQEFIAGIHPLVRSVFPDNTGSALIDMRLRQMLACLHGTAALLIAHPKAYRLNMKKALDDAESTFRSLIANTKQA